MQSAESSISYHPLALGEESGADHLVLDIFSEFVAPQFSQEGIAEFKKYISVNGLKDRLREGNLVLLAKSGPSMVGIIEIRDNRHIALLFVNKSHQRRGIGKELIRRAINICATRDPDIRTFSVNASPNAFSAYQKMGFKGMEDEKVVNGIRFIPMELTLQNICGQAT